MPYKDLNKQKQYQKHWNTNTQKEIHKQLGMPMGTACHRLKQQLFFKLLKELKKNFCYDCKKEILTANEVSVQHKKVWLHIDPRLFWDLDNIAFSHKKCNKTERRFSPQGEKSGRAKLNNKQVLEMREMSNDNKIFKKDIALKYNISDRNLRDITHRRSWKNI
jgi:hypothetical protein